MKRIISIPALLLSGLLLLGGFTSCSDDDDNSSTTGTGERLDRPDEIAELQQALVVTDAQGNFQRRILGVHLAADGADTTLVSVGVSDLNEAKEIFSNLFADTTAISADGLHATFTLATDKGGVDLVAANGSSTTAGLVASVRFDQKLGLKHISGINFIKNEAWPENASTKSMYKIGQTVRMHGWAKNSEAYVCDYSSNKVNTIKLDASDYFTYYCIREYANGKNGILVGFSDKDVILNYADHDTWGGNMPSKKKAKEIGAITSSNWNYFSSLFGIAANTSSRFWIDSGSDYVFVKYTDQVFLIDGDVQSYKTGAKWLLDARVNGGWATSALFYREFGAKE